MSKNTLGAIEYKDHRHAIDSMKLELALYDYPEKVKECLKLQIKMSEYCEFHDKIVSQHGDDVEAKFNLCKKTNEKIENVYTELMALSSSLKKLMSKQAYNSFMTNITERKKNHDMLTYIYTVDTETFDKFYEEINNAQDQDVYKIIEKHRKTQ